MFSDSFPVLTDIIANIVFLGQTDYNPITLKKQTSKTQRVITIDGPAGAGKSTVAALLAQKLSACYLDTGAMYRAITLAALQQNIDIDDDQAMKEIAQKSQLEITWQDHQMRITLDGQDISEAIRQPDVTDNTSKIAANPGVRNVLVSLQRHIAFQADTLITEGRDQGTVVFPDATIKFYLDANHDERVQRRYQELKDKGTDITYDEIHANITQRDQRDTQRSVAPLKPAPDAIRIDSTGLTLDQVVELFCQHIKEKEVK